MEIFRDFNLKPFNTFHVPARAARMARFKNVEELRALLNDPELKDLPRLVLGGGSNVLFTQDWPGVVLLNEIGGMELLLETDEAVIVRAGAGMVWHNFVSYCVDQGWGGVENLSLIPGRVGAAPMQNIGAYGVEIKEPFHHLEALRISDGQVVRFDTDACHFGYRESFFKREGKGQYIILSVAFQLNKQPKLHTHYGSIKAELDKRDIASPTIRDVSEAVIAIRRSKLPNPEVIGNAGSFFKNPLVDPATARALQAIQPQMPAWPAGGQVKLSAAWLIEQAGLKGWRDGDAGVSERHALVLVNHGSASGADLWRVARHLMVTVRQRFGVTLEVEPRVIGGGADG